MTLIIWVVEAQYHFTLKIQNQDARVLLAVENAHQYACCNANTSGTNV